MESKLLVLAYETPMLSRLHLLLLLVVAVPAARSDVRSDQEKRLKEAFRGQKLVIRNFYIDDNLVFSPAAKVIVGGRPGDWTLARFEVEKIRLRLDKLIFEGHRSHLVYDKDSDDFFNVPQYDKVKIEIELDPAHASEADLADLISKVFVTKQDELEDTVPEPWKTILREQLKANTMLGGQVYKAGPGIKPPTVIHPTRDPEYSEEARKARIQGEVALAIVVDVDGRPKNIKVVRSVGHGLDEESMRAIKHWRFNPGTKDGVPVPVQVDVTMNFRLGFF